MNYRTLAKGALALSLSLIVGSAMAVNTTTTDVQKYGATFENQANPPENDYDYVVDTPVTTYATPGGNPSGWFGAAEDESKIIAVTGGQALQLNTDAGVLTNKLQESIATDINNNGIAAAGAYIETEAKFVASDTLDAGVVGGTDDTKFAIYAYADESKSPCTTNLVVYHAYYDANGEIAYINEVFDTLVDCDVYTKLRVEMKQMKNPSRQNVNVFSVKVGNSAALVSENTLDAYLDEELEEGIWFLTVEDQLGGSATKQLSSVTFKGTGEVDNLAVGIINETTTYAIDWSASQNVIASNLTDNVQLAAGDTNFANNVQLAFYPTAGNVINSVNGVTQTPALDVFTYTVNAADTNLTIIAGAPALDNNWTIAGFNPRGEWTDPTAVAADSKTLFYSNLVVNIDPIGDGRTIPAAWVGAQVTASAAASADLANWKFDYDSQSGSRVTGASFSQNKDGDNFLYWWIPITADAVRAAIANQSDIVKTMVVYTDSASSAEAQTLTVSICPQNIEITNTGDVENGETIDVDDWQEQGAVEPTVITVACVGGVTYTEANGVYTFTADTGYAISSIYTNGADTATASTGILDLSAAEGTINVVAAAKKIRTAPAHKWWENPGVVGTTAHGLATGGTYGIWHLNGDGDYIAGTSWATQDNMVKGYDVDALVAGTASPVISNRYDLTSKKYVWGAAVSMALNTVFVGSYTEDPIVAPALAYPLNVAEGTMGVDSFVISNDQGIAINDAEFTADGQFLYAAAYYPTASRQYVYKFRVLNGLKSSGMNLEYVEKYDFGQRIRSIGLGQFSGKDVVYALLNDKTVKYVDTSAAEPVATELISEYTVLGGNYGDVVVSGADTETPHITIFGSNSSKTAYSIDVYTLTTTGTLASSDPVLALDTAAVAALGLSNSQFAFSGFVTENEETLILSWGTSNLYAIQYVEPTYDVTVTVEGGTISTGIDAVPTGSTLHVAAGTEIVFTAATGNTLSSVTTNTIAVAGIDTSATTYTYTVGDSDATVAVVFAAPSAQKPAWAEASGDGTENDPYWTWATAHAAGQDLYAEGADYSAQYLMNVDADKTPVLKIDSIGVAAGVVQLVVSATDGTAPISLKTINGVLSVAVGDTLAALTPTACNASVNDQDGRATINLPANSGNFFRARVDFAAPTGE